MTMQVVILRSVRSFAPHGTRLRNAMKAFSTEWQICREDNCPNAAARWLRAFRYGAAPQSNWPNKREKATQTA